MGERIGKVFLDTTYYPGEDLYSDGAIEDEMLAIARDHAPEEFNQVIAERESWPILYHFSHIRENILSWVPFKGDEKVLEVGAGCGAVTGALCRNAGEVTSIDLSMKRSRINAYRHRDQENLKILVGNFQEIEKNLTEKYDYITLIGVFEYGEAYIQSEDPYVDFLKIISRHLKPDGKIILAIENRLGLKYWAGCTEDHFGTLFEGIQGYPNTKGVKTFSRKEFNTILKDAGDLKADWYYPYPDYKFPMTIHSDRYLPASGELNMKDYNFDRLRLGLFQESQVYNTLLSNDLYPQFSNSFLLVIGKEQPQMEPVYVKFSNERNQKLSIYTEISQTAEGRLTVKKVPTQKKATEHVQKLKTIYENLTSMYREEGIEVNRCTLKENSAELEYLTGITLEDKLDHLLEDGRTDELEELFFTYIQKVKNIHEKKAFEKTPEFIRVFGDVNLRSDLKSTEVSNIDFVPANIILSEDRVSVIDYEWTFTFPVPSQFLVYRMIFYYLELNDKRGVLKSRNFYEKAGITEKDIEVYVQMEHNFQQYILGEHTAMRNMYAEISPGRVEMADYYAEKKQESMENLQIFWDNGKSFNEADSVRYLFRNRKIQAEFKLPEHTTMLRLDPGEMAKGLRIIKMNWDDGSTVKFHTDGCEVADGEFYFGGDDPQIIIDSVPENTKSMEMEMEILDDKTTEKKFWNIYTEQKRAMDQMSQELAQKKALVDQVESSKAWKVYRAIKRV